MGKHKIHPNSLANLRPVGPGNNLNPTGRPKGSKELAKIIREKTNNLDNGESAVDSLQIEKVSLDKLKAWERNPRKGHAIDQIAKSIKLFGYASPIIVQKGTYRILAGHGRLKALQKLNVTQVPVVILDIDDNRADLYTLADNKLTELASWDFSTMADLLVEFDQKNLDTRLTGFNDEEITQIMELTPNGEAKDETEPTPELPKDPVSKIGDLWELGKHRILCGDSTNASNVTKVLNESNPHLCVTDPPYGMNYQPNWRNEVDRSNGKLYSDRAIGLVTNDNRSDWSSTWNLFPGDVIYSWHPAGATSLIHGRALQKSGFILRMQIIWAKNHFPISRGDYHIKHEPCWYAVRDGKSSLRTNDRTHHTLWEIEKPRKSETGHSTQKPLECMARPIRNHEGDVYDPFVGSGTTIIASEQLKRRCYAIEIEPSYVDVSVKRWQNYTGRQAKNLTRPDVRIE